MRRRGLIASLALMTMLGVCSCGGDSTTIIADDGRGIEFDSDDFHLVGDVHLPSGTEPFPAVIIVHGDGPQTRSSTPGTQTVIDTFGEAGFAVLAWDKPGSGESTGEFDQGETLRQRAAIVAAGVDALQEHPSIDPERIGLWGISQAGWVMPLALEKTDDVAFMIVVSGGGEDSIDQLAYQLGQDKLCSGSSPADAALVEQHFPATAKGPTYADYLNAMDELVKVDGWENFAGPELKTEDEWQPWPSDIDAYFDPMTVVEKTTIPVLAVFGNMDRYVDPVQGAAAYDQALESAGNDDYQVELLPDVGHTMLTQTSKCGGEGGLSERYLEILDEWAKELGDSTTG